MLPAHDPEAREVKEDAADGELMFMKTAARYAYVGVGWTSQCGLPSYYASQINIADALRHIG
jgi:hypothetical protein